MNGPANHRPEIDGLRAVAVIPVILFHAGFSAFRGGFVGVDVFFVLSGYLITALILRGMGEGGFSLLDFYARRARRILPALFLVMACCIPFALAWMLPSELRDFGRSLVAVSLFLSNVLFWRQGGYFSLAIDEKPLLHTWSLAVEEQFYLVFPLLRILLWRFGRRPIFHVILWTALVSLLLAEWGWRHAPTANYYLAPTRAWEILAGALCAFWPAGRGRALAGPLSATGLGLILAAVAIYRPATPSPSAYMLLPVAGAALVILFASPATLCGRLLASPPFVGVGLISYSAYLWHQPLFAFARIKGHPVLGDALAAALSVATLALAVLSWKYLERPFRQGQFAIFRSRRMVLGFAAATSMILAGLGLAAVLTDGLGQRYAPADRALAQIDADKARAYVEQRFDAHRAARFPDNGRRDVLIIGDSYAQDVFNAMAEAGSVADLNIVTRRISRNCGDFVPHHELVAHLSRDERAVCAAEGGYDDPRVMALLRQADVVVLVSAWREWQLPYLDETVRRIESVRGARVIVVGAKSFGRIDVRELLAVPASRRPGLTNPLSPGHIRLNVRMADLGLRDFVDVQRIVCESRSRCRVFTPSGRLISYDGAHLTRDGAIFVGDRLLAGSPVLASVFAPPRDAAGGA